MNTRRKPTTLPSGRSGLQSRRRVSGFSLIELLIVVAIILVIAGMAIPRFLRSKMMANETSAAAAMRALATVQVTYQTSYQQGYPPNLAALGPPAAGSPPSAAAADLIDAVLTTGVKGGYRFTYAPVDTNGDAQFDTYTITGNPLTPQAGEKYFFVDQTNVVRFAVGAPATAASQPIPP